MPVDECQSAFTFLGQADQERLLGSEDKSTMIFRNVGRNFSNDSEIFLETSGTCLGKVPFIFENHTNRSIQSVDSTVCTVAERSETS